MCAVQWFTVECIVSQLVCEFYVALKEDKPLKQWKSNANESSGLEHLYDSCVIFEGIHERVRVFPSLFPLISLSPGPGGEGGEGEQRGKDTCALVDFFENHTRIVSY